MQYFDYLHYLFIYSILYGITNIILKKWYPRIFTQIGFTFKSENIIIDPDKFRQLKEKSKDGFATLIKSNNEIIIYQNPFQSILGENKVSILNIRAFALILDNKINISYKLSIVGVLLNLTFLILLLPFVSVFFALANWTVILIFFAMLALFSAQNYFAIESNYKRIREVLIRKLEPDNKKNNT